MDSLCTDVLALIASLSYQPVPLIPKEVDELAERMRWGYLCSRYPGLSESFTAFQRLVDKEPEEALAWLANRRLSLAQQMYLAKTAAQRGMEEVVNLSIERGVPNLFQLGTILAKKGMWTTFNRLPDEVVDQLRELTIPRELLGLDDDVLEEVLSYKPGTPVRVLLEDIYKSDGYPQNVTYYMMTHGMTDLAIDFLARYPELKEDILLGTAAIGDYDLMTKLGLPDDCSSLAAEAARHGHIDLVKRLPVTDHNLVSLAAAEAGILWGQPTDPTEVASIAAVHGKDLAYQLSTPYIALFLATLAACEGHTSLAIKLYDSAVVDTASSHKLAKVAVETDNIELLEHISYDRLSLLPYIRTNRMARYLVHPGDPLPNKVIVSLDNPDYLPLHSDYRLLCKGQRISRLLEDGECLCLLSHLLTINPKIKARLNAQGDIGRLIQRSE